MSAKVSQGPPSVTKVSHDGSKVLVTIKSGSRSSTLHTRSKKDENRGPLWLSGESSRVCGLVVVKVAREPRGCLVTFL